MAIPLLGLAKAAFFSKTFRIGLIGAVAGFALGAYAVHVIAEAKRADALSDALAAKNKAIQRVISENERIRTLDSEVAFAKDQVITRIVEQEVQIPTEVIKYVPHENNLACSLTIGAVGLLNRARRAGLPADDQPAAIPDAESRATSAVTQRAEVAAHADCAIRFNKLKAKHDALTDWLEEAHLSQ